MGVELDVKEVTRSRLAGLQRLGRMAHLPYSVLTCVTEPRLAEREWIRSL